MQVAPILKKSLLTKSEQDIPQIRNSDILEQENALHGRIAKLLGNINSMNDQVQKQIDDNHKNFDKNTGPSHFFSFRTNENSVSDFE